MPELSLANLGQFYNPQPPNGGPLSSLGAIPADMSLLAQMLQKQRDQQEPRAFMRTIDPGQTWGGRDPNNVHPDDVMRARFYAQPPESM